MSSASEFVRAERLAELSESLTALRVEHEDIKERWAIALRTPRKEDLDQIATLKAQRDELLKACRDTREYIQPLYGMTAEALGRKYEILTMLNAIIAAVEKEGK